MKLNKKGIIRLSVFLFFVLVAAWLAFGERGLIHLYKMEGRRQQYRERIKELEKKNHELLREIESLRTDEAYIESLARHELNLLKDNEVQFRLTDEPRSGVTTGGPWLGSGESGPEMTFESEPEAPGAASD
ncbi:MAG: FtsB family cell division protein [Thermodesulfobacteriota bacterium]